MTAERAKEAGAAGLIVINSEGNIVDMTTGTTTILLCFISIGT